jgi:membrane-bound lytic murein transglycosylase D
MAFRQFPGLRVSVLLAIAAACGAGCTFGRVPASGFQPTDQPTTKSFPGDPVALTDSGQTTALASPERNASAPDPNPPSPLARAMARADSHYERGLLAMRSGKTDQAEWEFDAALETLLDTGLGPALPPRLLGTDRSSEGSLHGWLSPAVRAPQPVTESLPRDPDEPTQEAPALVGPDDLQAIAKERPEDTLAVPDPRLEKSEFPIVYNDQVKTFVGHFQTRKWGVVARAFERASRYLPMMRKVFQEKALPEELINLAFIESAVNPWATSKAKAAGIWQFMASTGRLYGMQVSWWVDERRDPEKATRGAAEYLKNLYRMFGSWELALAAYNAGEGAVQRAIDRQRTRNFWALRLPKETQLFVPAFMAMTIISKDPERYGFSPPPDEPFETDLVTLDHPADFRSLAQAARTSVERLRELNPELIRWSTPPGVARYTLRIPAGVKADFVEELAGIPAAQRVGWITHRVRKGETAPVIAKRYGASLQAVLDMNGLGKRPSLKPGSSLLVPASTAPPVTVTAEADAGRAKREAARTKTPSRHAVKKGETVAQVAQAYGVSSDDLRRWNGLSRTTSLKPGQTLKVTAPATQVPTAGLQKQTASPSAKPTPVPTPARRYTVKRGDTLAAIARAHGVSPEDLRHWNGLSRTVSLKPGQELRILAPQS